MKRRRLLTSLVLAILVALSGAAMASAQVSGPAAGATAAPAASGQIPDRVTVLVKLTNGTPGSRVPGNVPLELFAYDGPSIVSSLQGVAGPSGEYLFEGVSYKDGRAFGVVATVGQTNYASAIEPLGPGGTRIDVPLVIYDTTANTDQLRIFQMYVLGEFVSPNEVQVTDAYLLSNAGNRTIEGGEKGPDGKAATLRFDLPKGASKVEFQADDDQSYVPTDGGFLYTRGVPPGTGSLQVAVRYTLPYSGQLHLQQAVRYPAQTVSVLWANQGGVTVAGAALNEQGTRSRQDGVVFRVFSAGALTPGQALVFDVNGTPNLVSTQADSAQVGSAQPGTAQENAASPNGPVTGQATGPNAAGGAAASLPAIPQFQDLIWALRATLATVEAESGPGLWVSLFGLAIMLACGINWLIGRRRARLIGHPDVQQHALVQALVDLEEDYQAGRVAEEDYRGRFEQLREALVALTDFSEPLYETSKCSCLALSQAWRCKMQRQRPLFLGTILLGLLLALLPGTAAAASGTTHVVQPGDTLASIAESHGVSVLSLIRANGISDPDLIRTGQTLQIPGASAPAPVQPAPATPGGPGAPVQAESRSTGASSASSYTVKPGQTLSQIAAELDLSAAAIARQNGLTDPDLIRAGMVLQLPPTPAQTGVAYAGQGTRFVASIAQQHCWLYVEGQLVGSWRCSTGRASAPTVPGTYRIQSRINPAYASTWDFWMPYWLGIYDAGGSENGIHGLPYDPDTGRKTWEGLVGTPITFGCIMLDNENASKVYEVAYEGMPVIVLP